MTLRDHPICLPAQRMICELTFRKESSDLSAHPWWKERHLYKIYKMIRCWIATTIFTLFRIGNSHSSICRSSMSPLNLWFSIEQEFPFEQFASATIIWLSRRYTL